MPTPGRLERDGWRDEMALGGVNGKDRQDPADGDSCSSRKRLTGSSTTRRMVHISHYVSLSVSPLSVNPSENSVDSLECVWNVAGKQEKISLRE